MILFWMYILGGAQDAGAAKSEVGDARTVEAVDKGARDSGATGGTVPRHHQKQQLLDRLGGQANPEKPTVD